MNLPYLLFQAFPQSLNFSTYQPVGQSLPFQSKPNQGFQRGRGNNRRPFRGGKGRGNNWNTAPSGPRSCLIVLTQEEPKKEALPGPQESVAKDSTQPAKSKLLLPQDKWASSGLSGISDENSQSSTPTRPKGKSGFDDSFEICLRIWLLLQHVLFYWNQLWLIKLKSSKFISLIWRIFDIEREHLRIHDLNTYWILNQNWYFHHCMFCT